MDLRALYEDMKVEGRAGGGRGSSGGGGGGGGGRGAVSSPAGVRDVLGASAPLTSSPSSASPASATRSSGPAAAPPAGGRSSAAMASLLGSSMLGGFGDVPYAPAVPAAAAAAVAAAPAAVADVAPAATPAPTTTTIVLAECADSEALVAALRRDLVMLSADGEGAAPAARRGAMKSVTNALFGYDFTADAIVLPGVTADGGVEVVATARTAGGDAAERVRLTTHEGGVVAGALPALYKMLCRRVSDGAEGVRLGAVQTLTAYLATRLAARDVPMLVPYLVPALAGRAASAYVLDIEAKAMAVDAATAEAHRRGRVLEAHQGSLALREDALYKPPAADASEAVRVATARCATALIDAIARAGSLALLDAYWHDVMMAAHALAVDSSPDVREAGAATLVAAARAAPHVTAAYAVPFVKSIMVVGLQHRLARVRLATLAAVEELVAAPETAKWRGGGSEAIMALLGTRDANVIPVSAFYRADTTVNYFARLIVDPNPEVRHRFTRTLARWATVMLDRHEWWSRLLPYLLSCLCDTGEVASAPRDGAAVRAARGRVYAPEDLLDVAPGLPIDVLALATLDTLGAEHEREHRDKLLDRIQSGVDGDPEVDYGGPLPPPFTTRPRLGVRLFVRAHAPRFIKAVLSEIGSFEPFAGACLAAASGINTRVRAAQLLCHTLVLAEEQFTQDANLLLPALVSIIHDTPGGGATGGGTGVGAIAVGDDSLALYGAMASRLVGRFMPPTAYIAQLLPFATGAALLPARRGALADPEAEHAAGIAAACHVLWLALAESRASRVLPCLPTLLDPATGVLHPDIVRTMLRSTATWCQGAAHRALLAAGASAGVAGGGGGGFAAAATVAPPPPLANVSGGSAAVTVNWLSAAAVITSVLCGGSAGSGGGAASGGAGGGMRAVAGAVFDRTGRLLDAAMRANCRNLARLQATVASQLAMAGWLPAAGSAPLQLARLVARVRTSPALAAADPLADDAAGLYGVAASAVAALEPSPAAATSLLAGLTAPDLTAALEDTLGDYPSASLWQPACAPHAMLVALTAPTPLAAMLAQDSDARAHVVDMLIDVGTSLATDVAAWLGSSSWRLPAAAGWIQDCASSFGLGSSGGSGGGAASTVAGTAPMPVHVLPLDEVHPAAPAGGTPAATMLLPFLAWVVHVLPPLAGALTGDTSAAAASADDRVGAACARLVTDALGRDVVMRVSSGAASTAVEVHVPLLALLGGVAGCESTFLSALASWQGLAAVAGSCVPRAAALPLATHLLTQAAAWTSAAVPCTCAHDAPATLTGVRHAPLPGGAASACAAVVRLLSATGDVSDSDGSDGGGSGSATALLAAAYAAAAAARQAVGGAAGWAEGGEVGAAVVAVLDAMAGGDEATSLAALDLAVRCSGGCTAAADDDGEDAEEVLRPPTLVDELQHRCFAFAAAAPPAAASGVVTAAAPWGAPGVVAALVDHLALLAHLRGTT